jgi:hypothetical protein
MAEIKGMDGCKRCPDCLKVPTTSIIESAFDNRPVAELRCELHGHVAQGDTVEQAVHHWNIYVTFVENTRIGKVA